MRKSLFGLIVLSALLFLSSCTKKIYTHQQVMQGFHTKDDVLKRFGKPDEIKEGNDIEEWTYNGATIYNTDKGKTQELSTNAIPDTLKDTQASKYSKYIRFIFDKDGNVAGYKTQGVDLTTVTKEKVGITILKVLGIAALVVIVIGSSIDSNIDVNF
jgi:hypothetical protein